MQSSETTLHAKLREAAHRINELTKEREKLIKMGNKLRAELLKYKGTSCSLLTKLQCHAANNSNFIWGIFQTLQVPLQTTQVHYPRAT
jgi:hypothetical protein